MHNFQCMGPSMVLDQKIGLLKILSKNHIFLQKHKKVNWKKIIFHFENIYASIGFMAS